MTPIVRSLSIASFSRRSLRLKTVELPKGIEHRRPEGTEACASETDTVRV